MSPETADHRIAIPAGSLFARSWRPAGGGAGDIVLIHDSLGCVALWRDFPGVLAAATGHRVIAWDRLGFGRSDPHPGPLPEGFVGREAEAGLRPVCAALGVGPMVLVGHSVGGGMAIAAAARMPDRVRAVVTMAAQSFVEDRTRDGIRAAEAAFRDPAQRARLERHHGRNTGWALDAWIGTWLSPAFAGWTLDADLVRVRCPVLAIHGDADEYGSTAHAARIAAGVPGPAGTLVVAGGGHFPHRERPAETADAVARFLGRVGEPPAA
ncbi:MAG: alpha/beta fold hydrolase [Rhodospirillales bacterium]|jgi:pimeloyl-ACP methyl ester carboxylesterase